MPSSCSPSTAVLTWDANPGRSRVAEHLAHHVLAKGLMIGTFERL